CKVGITIQDGTSLQWRGIQNADRAVLITCYDDEGAIRADCAGIVFPITGEKAPSSRGADFPSDPHMPYLQHALIIDGDDEGAIRTDGTDIDESIMSVLC